MANLKNKKWFLQKSGCLPLGRREEDTIGETGTVVSVGEGWRTLCNYSLNHLCMVCPHLRLSHTHTKIDGR